MPNKRWQQVQELFHAALPLPAPERAAFLTAQCNGDAALRTEVEALLAQDIASDTRIGAAVEASAAALARAVAPVHTGELLGHYRILSQIAAGGMGAVYLAERADRQFEHRVAIKFLAAGLIGAHAHDRFLSERQILAGLHHPYIAQLIDGGATGGGTPYLVMEYIDGQSVLRYCDERRLTTRERLALFLKVCEAVQYAHQNLVIHRDIKPSNILVTKEGLPKLLDFGIAKLMAPQAEQSLALTRADHRLLTPESASPEQVRGEAVTTATDVYALGLLLYELLCGRFAFEFPSAQLADVERVICSVDPVRPSQRVEGNAEPGNDAGHAGLNRRIRSPRLRRELAGDLDTIVLCALRKEPGRRYPTVRELAEDIERFLGNLPIRARPDSFGYRARKFAVRNRAVLAATGVALAVVSTTVGAYTWHLERERDRATLAAAKSEQVSGFLTKLFREADPWKAPGSNRTAAEMLAQGVNDIDSLAAQPAVQAELLYVMGQAYTSLGAFDKAIPLLERTLTLQRADPRSHPPAVTAAFNALGHTHRVAGQLRQAEKVLRDALAYNEDLLGPSHEGVVRVLNTLGTLLHDMDRGEEAVAALSRALAIRESLGKTEDTWAADILNNLAISLDSVGRLPEAIATHRRAVTLNRKLLGPRHPNLATGIDNLSLVLEQSGELDESERLKREALAMRRALHGNEYWMVALTESGLAVLLARRGNFTEALALAESGEGIARRTLGDKHAQYGRRARQLSSVRFDLADYRGAESAARAAVAAVQERPEEYGGDLILARAHLCEALLAQGRIAEARAAIEPAYLQRHVGRHRSAQAAQRMMARVLTAEGRFAEAEPLYQQTLSETERVYGNGNPLVGEPLMDLAAHHLRAGSAPRGLAFAQRAYDLYLRTAGERHWRTGEAAALLAEVLRVLDQAAEAKPLLETAHAALAGTFGEADPRVRRLVDLNP